MSSKTGTTQQVNGQNNCFNLKLSPILCNKDGNCQSRCSIMLKSDKSAPVKNSIETLFSSILEIFLNLANAKAYQAQH